MCRLAQGNHRIPGLVVECLRKGQVVSSQVERLLHVRESQARARVIGLWVEGKDLIDNVVSDGRKENTKICGDIFGRVDTGPGRTIGLVEFVGDYEGTRKVEALLV